MTALDGLQPGDGPAGVEVEAPELGHSDVGPVVGTDLLVGLGRGEEEEEREEDHRAVTKVN